MLLTVEGVFAMCLAAFGVVPLGPESPLLQPERRPDGVGHAQAARQPHAGLREPEATDGVPQLRPLHVSTPGRGERQGQQEETGLRCVIRVY